jgi:hypothetical protein
VRNSTREGKEEITTSYIVQELCVRVLAGVIKGTHFRFVAGPYMPFIMETPDTKAGCP